MDYSEFDIDRILESDLLDLIERNSYTYSNDKSFYEKIPKHPKPENQKKSLWNIGEEERNKIKNSNLIHRINIYFNHFFSTLLKRFIPIPDNPDVDNLYNFVFDIVFNLFFFSFIALWLFYSIFIFICHLKNLYNYQYLNHQNIQNPLQNSQTNHFSSQTRLNISLITKILLILFQLAKSFVILASSLSAHLILKKGKSKERFVLSTSLIIIGIFILETHTYGWTTIWSPTFIYNIMFFFGFTLNYFNSYPIAISPIIFWTLSLFLSTEIKSFERVPSSNQKLLETSSRLYFYQSLSHFLFHSKVIGIQNNFVFQHSFDFLKTFIASIFFYFCGIIVGQVALICVESACVVSYDTMQLSRKQMQLVSQLSHELRTPISAIIGWNELMMEDEHIDSERRVTMGHIHNASLHLFDLLNTILDVSKLGAKKMELQSSNFDLHSLVLSIAQIMVGKTVEGNLELLIDFPISIPRNYVGDSGRIRQILLNLLSNAIKFTGPGGEVKIIVRRLRSTALKSIIEIRIRDTGCGIPIELHSLLFREFVQIGNNDNSRAKLGTGLGLYLVKSLTEMMGGRVWIKSMPNVGSVFGVRLPLVHQHTSPTASDTNTESSLLLKEKGSSRNKPKPRLDPKNNEVILESFSKAKSGLGAIPLNDFNSDSSVLSSKESYSRANNGFDNHSDSNIKPLTPDNFKESPVNSFGINSGFNKESKKIHSSLDKIQPDFGLENTIPDYSEESVLFDWMSKTESIIIGHSQRFTEFMNQICQNRWKTKSSVIIKIENGFNKKSFNSQESININHENDPGSFYIDSPQKSVAGKNKMPIFFVDITNINTAVKWINDQNPNQNNSHIANAHLEYKKYIPNLNNQETEENTIGIRSISEWFIQAAENIVKPICLENTEDLDLKNSIEQYNSTSDSGLFASEEDRKELHSENIFISKKIGNPTMKEADSSVNGEYKQNKFEKTENSKIYLKIDKDTDSEVYNNYSDSILKYSHKHSEFGFKSKNKASKGVKQGIIVFFYTHKQINMSFLPPLIHQYYSIILCRKPVTEPIIVDLLKLAVPKLEKVVRRKCFFCLNNEHINQLHSSNQSWHNDMDFLYSIGTSNSKFNSSKLQNSSDGIISTNHSSKKEKPYIIKSDSFISYNNSAAKSKQDQSSSSENMIVINNSVETNSNNQLISISSDNQKVEPTQNTLKSPAEIFSSLEYDNIAKSSKINRGVLANNNLVDDFKPKLNNLSTPHPEKYDLKLENPQFLKMEKSFAQSKTLEDLYASSVSTSLRAKADTESGGKSNARSYVSVNSSKPKKVASDQILSETVKSQLNLILNKSKANSFESLEHLKENSRDNQTDQKAKTKNTRYSNVHSHDGNFGTKNDFSTSSISNKSVFSADSVLLKQKSDISPSVTNSRKSFEIRNRKGFSWKYTPVIGFTANWSLPKNTKKFATKEKNKTIEPTNLHTGKQSFDDVIRNAETEDLINISKKIVDRNNIYKENHSLATSSHKQKEISHYTDFQLPPRSNMHSNDEKIHFTVKTSVLEENDLTSSKDPTPITINEVEENSIPAEKAQKDLSSIPSTNIVKDIEQTNTSLRPITSRIFAAIENSKKSHQNNKENINTIDAKAYFENYKPKSKSQSANPLFDSLLKQGLTTEKDSEIQRHEFEKNKNLQTDFDFNQNIQKTESDIVFDNIDSEIHLQKFETLNEKQEIDSLLKTNLNSLTNNPLKNLSQTKEKVSDETSFQEKEIAQNTEDSHYVCKYSWGNTKKKTLLDYSLTRSPNTNGIKQFELNKRIDKIDEYAKNDDSVMTGVKINVVPDTNLRTQEITNLNKGLANYKKVSNSNGKMNENDISEFIDNNEEYLGSSRFDMVDLNKNQNESKKSQIHKTTSLPTSESYKTNASLQSRDNNNLDIQGMINQQYLSSGTFETLSAPLWTTSSSAGNTHSGYDSIHNLLENRHFSDSKTSKESEKGNLLSQFISAYMEDISNNYNYFSANLSGNSAKTNIRNPSTSSKAPSHLGSDQNYYLWEDSEKQNIDMSLVKNNSVNDTSPVHTSQNSNVLFRSNDNHSPLSNNHVTSNMESFTKNESVNENNATLGNSGDQPARSGISARKSYTLDESSEQPIQSEISTKRNSERIELVQKAENDIKLLPSTKKDQVYSAKSYKERIQMLAEAVTRESIGSDLESYKKHSRFIHKIQGNEAKGIAFRNSLELAAQKHFNSQNLKNHMVLPEMQKNFYKINSSINQGNEIGDWKHSSSSEKLERFMSSYLRKQSENSSYNRIGTSSVNRLQALKDNLRNRKKIIETPRKDHPTLQNEGFSAATAELSKNEYIHKLPLHNSLSSTIKIESTLSKINPIPEHPSSAHTPRILVADDSPSNRVLLVQQLKKLGFTDVDSATDGVTACNQFQVNKYSLIFMDIQMPLVDGYQATKYIREVEKRYLLNIASGNNKDTNTDTNKIPADTASIGPNYYKNTFVTQNSSSEQRFSEASTSENKLKLQSIPESFSGTNLQSYNEDTNFSGYSRVLILALTADTSVKDSFENNKISRNLSGFDGVYCKPMGLKALYSAISLWMPWHKFEVSISKQFGSNTN
ncbi:hypothetical protein BB558_003815 [Smittium angustum]|uniref:histidine kinase n=1 Tax=Smittium angustum TaxID=133377 RepID=A0A2U1J4Y5_SMIAN|nr:hypothetical protein BB558_003815 [Smittium angustum]